ncbi:unnamed protein product [Trichogramma brassicae]|uniref:Uncharacterized protein n=1 Tax=Trichogramma brassicae TaxID=86971 RepID=A0A6H5J2J2_9HYME|nr:unnamed protein product [Trichogramma brassicae]
MPPSFIRASLSSFTAILVLITCTPTRAREKSAVEAYIEAKFRETREHLLNELYTGAVRLRGRLVEIMEQFADDETTQGREFLRIRRRRSRATSLPRRRCRAPVQRVDSLVATLSGLQSGSAQRLSTLVRARSIRQSEFIFILFLYKKSMIARISIAISEPQLAGHSVPARLPEPRLQPVSRPGRRRSAALPSGPAAARGRSAGRRRLLRAARRQILSARALLRCQQSQRAADQVSYHLFNVKDTCNVVVVFF